jgi:hypothetical protein
VLKSIKQVVDHLKYHKQNGHRVPDYALERAEYELETGKSIWGGPL